MLYLLRMPRILVSKNTSISTRWAMKNLQNWFEDYNKRNLEHPCPDDILSPFCKAEVLNEWLRVFIQETRTKNGERFSTFQTTLDNVFKVLRSSGVGLESKHTEGISAEEEDMLWSSGVLNDTSPYGLLRAVFFYMGKCFCLRGGQEHRDLCPSQLQRLQSPDRYMYKEKASKNRQGGIAQLKLEHKAVFIFRNPEAGVRCPVHLFDKYMSKLPPEVFFKDFFYCRPLSVVPIDPAKPWYVASPVGRNQLGKMVSTMCESAGITGVKTNHSLRVSGASALFDAGVPERIIQGRTGHRCLESLRVYE